MLNFISELHEQKSKIMKKKKNRYMFKLKFMNKKLKNIIGNNVLHLKI